MLQVWQWIVANWPGFIALLAQTKTIPDVFKAWKEMAPDKLESKEAGIAIAKESMELIEGGRETNEWEIEKKEMILGKVVQITAIEASYNIARYAIFTAFTAWIVHVLTRVLFRKTSQR